MSDAPRIRSRMAQVSAVPQRSVSWVRLVMRRWRGRMHRTKVLARLRRTQREQSTPSQLERELALEMRERREELAKAFDEVRCCATCNVEHASAPWLGGRCCELHTDALFTEDELASMKFASIELPQPSGALMERFRAIEAEIGVEGCVFRAVAGCVLTAAQRPTVCSLYLCRLLEHELLESGQLERIDRLRGELEGVWKRFVAARRARALDEFLEE